MAEIPGRELPAPLIPDYQFKTITYFRQGWQLFASNVSGFLGFTVLWLFLNLALNSVRGLGSALAFVINPPLWAGLVVVSLKVWRQQPVVANDYLEGFKLIIPLVVYWVVSSVFISLGLLLLLLPGIYLAVGYLFSIWLIVERGLDFWAAMELSRRTIHRHWFEVFGFVILLFLLNVAGLLLLGLGLLVTLPWSICSITAAYVDVFGSQVG